MDKNAQLMGVPIKLVMALVIGTMAMGILMQFIGTAERTILKDMKVTFPRTTSDALTVNVFDAQSGDALGGTTIVLKYPGGMKAYTCGENSNQYSFNVPMPSSNYAVVTVQVTRNGYIPWEGQVAISSSQA
jgi:hypothetical protein